MTGNPVLFTTVNSEKSFWSVNPDVIAMDIMKATKEKIFSDHITKDGNLVINDPSKGAAQNLMDVKKIAGIDVTASIPSSYLETMGRITNVPIWYKEDELLAYLQHYGVIGVRRETAYSREEDGTAKPHQKRSDLHTFKRGQNLPIGINLGFTCHPVAEYVAPPVQCFKGL